MSTEPKIPPTMTAEVQDAIQEDGSLHNLGWYLDWHWRSQDATLDGTFTAAELRAIADYMEANS